MLPRTLWTSNFHDVHAPCLHGSHYKHLIDVRPGLALLRWQQRNVQRKVQASEHIAESLHEQRQSSLQRHQRSQQQASAVRAYVDNKYSSAGWDGSGANGTGGSMLPDSMLGRKAVSQDMPPDRQVDNQARTSTTALVSVLERIDSLVSASDSLDYPDLEHSFSSEDDGSANHHSSGPQERPSTAQYPLSKSNYEVLRLDASGRTRKLYVRRRDLLREFRLQPRDLRRIDPSIDFTKTSPSITIKENVLLLCLGGVRAIVTAEKALLFEPGNLATRRLVDTIVPHLKSKADRGNTSSAMFPSSSNRAGLGSFEYISPTNVSGSPASNGLKLSSHEPQARWFASASHSEYMARFYSKTNQGMMRSPPFELEVLEGALIGATGRLDAELGTVAGRVQELLTRLPGDINPVSLEELRRVKASLVELEDKADNLRAMLEELMDDEDELRELNLSSRPRREERRRQRERDRLERELERAREIKEELEEQLEDDDNSQGPTGSNSRNNGVGRTQRSGNLSPSHYVDGDGSGYASWTGGVRAGSPMPGMANNNGSNPASIISVQSQSDVQSARDARLQRIAELRAKFDRERLADLRAKFSLGNSSGALSGNSRDKDGSQLRDALSSARDRRGSAGQSLRDREAERGERLERLERLRAARGDDADDDWISRLEQQLEGSEEDIQEAQEALEEMVEAEEEEAELEEVEDLLEYYLQRTTATASEAERLLEGARDLEESIGVSLSARRYEVNRLELTLSIGSFSAALGAMVAGIFGMNMKSMLEYSVASFWGITAVIIIGCCWVFYAIMRYTRQRRIL